MISKPARPMVRPQGQKPKLFKKRTQYLETAVLKVEVYDANGLRLHRLGFLQITMKCWCLENVDDAFQLGPRPYEMMQSY